MQSPIGTVIPYNRKIYTPYAFSIWRHFCAGEYVFIDTVEGAYVKDFTEAQKVNWPPECILGPCDVWTVLFDRGGTFGCCN